MVAHQENVVSDSKNMGYKGDVAAPYGDVVANQEDVHGNSFGKYGGSFHYRDVVANWKAWGLNLEMYCTVLCSVAFLRNCVGSLGRQDGIEEDVVSQWGDI